MLKKSINIILSKKVKARLHPLYKCYHDYYSRVISVCVSDKQYIIRKYKRIFGIKPNLLNPLGYAEKIQYRKLYEKNQKYVRCSDKYHVRNYVEKKIGIKYLKPLFVVSKEIDSINISDLPHSFVVKCNHGSGMNIFIWNKKAVDWLDIKKTINKWMKINYYIYSREWQYKNIKPLVMIEKLIIQNNNIPLDIHFHCYKGEVEYIGIPYCPYTENSAHIVFDKNNQMIGFVSKKNKIFDYSVDNLFCIDEAKRIASLLSEGFDYVRVDLMIVENIIYFSEMTFTPGSGFEKGYDEIHEKLSEKWEISTFA